MDNVRVTENFNMANKWEPPLEGRWFDITYKDNYVGWIAESDDVQGEWVSESAVTGMTWSNDDFDDAVRHLVEIYKENN